MSRKQTTKKWTAFTLSLACGVCALAGAANLQSVAADDSASGIELVYNTDEMIATQDVQQNQSDTSIYKLERDKTGMRLQSKQNGENVEGMGFSFANDFTGDFSMDFRIRSAQTYAHTAAAGWTHYLAEHKQSYLYDENFNPYADVQEVSFTFTSKSDASKYFTVFVRGSSADVAFCTSAGVYVPGDTMFVKTPEGEKKYGYGLDVWEKTLAYNGTAEYGAENYGINDMYTVMRGTSFSNFSSYSSGQTYYNDDSVNPNATSSNMIKFDATNMKVYVNAGQNGKYYGDMKGILETTTLVRDLATNEGYSSANNIAAGTLSAADFADGYTVNVQFTDMTSNSCVGNASNFGGATQYPTIISTPYERYADMYIYSVCGTTMTSGNYTLTGKETLGKYAREQSDFITYDESDFTLTENTEYKTYTGKGLALRANKSGADAIGTGFAFKDTVIGNFDLDFRIGSKTPYQYSSPQAWSTHYVQEGYYQNVYHDMYNPYQDVKEVAFTFTSVSDPTKWFTVYMYGGTQGYAYATSARVEVAGDKIGSPDVDGKMRYGYGLNESGEYKNVIDNTSLFGTSFSDYCLNSQQRAVTPVANGIYFDVETMCVYATGMNSKDYDRAAPYDKLVRNLLDNSTAAGYESNPENFGVINQSDFLGGYTVSVQFTDVTDNATQGDGTSVSGFGWFDQGKYDALETAYDRYPEMIIYAINGQNLAYIGEGKHILDDVAPSVIPGEMMAYYDEQINFAPKYYDVASGAYTPSTYGKVSVSTDGETYTEVAKTADDKYLYTPVGYGYLYVQYDGFADMFGNSKTQTYKLWIQDHIIPALAWKEGLSAETTYDFTSGRGAKPLPETKDVVVTNLPTLTTKTYDVFIHVVRPDGTITYATKLNYFEAGEYKFVYTVTDNFGNVGTIERTVLAGDFTKPQIMVKDSLSAKVGDRISLTPAVEDVSSVSVKIAVYQGDRQVAKGEEFVAQEAGEYTVKYTVMDKSGNVSEAQTKLVVSGVEESVSWIETWGLFDWLTVAFFTLGAVAVVVGVVLFVINKKAKREWEEEKDE